MKNVMRVSAFVIFVFFASALLRAQGQTKEQASQAGSAVAETQFRIGVVVSEYDGAKKISSLPYTLNATSSSSSPRIRIGFRVPVATEKTGGSSTQYQYIDVGTNIDCTVGKELADGKYPLDFIVDRSAPSVPGSVNTKNEWSLGDAPPYIGPMIQRFLGQFHVLLRDGQTQEATSATDPLTGHVLKVEVTLNVVK